MAASDRSAYCGARGNPAVSWRDAPSPQRPTRPDPPSPSQALALWTCTTPLPPAGSSPRCSRTALGCPSAPPSAPASRWPPPRPAAPAGSPRSPAGLAAPAAQDNKLLRLPRGSYAGLTVHAQKKETLERTDGGARERSALGLRVLRPGPLQGRGQVPGCSSTARHQVAQGWESNHL